MRSNITEWGLLLVSCLEQGSEKNDIFGLGGTPLPKVPLSAPQGISGGWYAPHHSTGREDKAMKHKYRWTSQLTHTKYLPSPLC